MYSACSPQLSHDVKIINSCTLSSSSICFIFSINLSINLSGTPKLELIANLRFLFGFSCAKIYSNTSQVSLCINGSPPVILNVCKSLYKSGHHVQNASTYGLCSLNGIGILPSFNICNLSLNLSEVGYAPNSSISSIQRDEN